MYTYVIFDTKYAIRSKYSHKDKKSINLAVNLTFSGQKWMMF